MKTSDTIELPEISPYNEIEFQNAMKRLLKHPALTFIAKSFFPDLSFETLQKILKEIKNVKDFQEKVISKVMTAILEQSSKGVSISGLENKSRNRQYLYISNHRDIICDPAFFTNSLFLADFGTPKICLGDNLLTDQLIIDLVKMNKGVTVRRHLSPRELLKSSYALSELIYQQINEGVDSVWIAQREGRAKDGNDQTQPGIIKMLTLTGEGSLSERLGALHIVPVAISYEYDPCDLLKARELAIRTDLGSYQKAPGEDTASMITGITGYKGRIHMSVGEEITAFLNQMDCLDSQRDQIGAIAEELDRQIHKNYHNWPSNYIAYDLLNQKPTMKDHYNKEQMEEFVERIEKRLESLESDESEKEKVKHFYLAGYANSIRNSLKSQ